jgi:hypothetical protein
MEDAKSQLVEKLKTANNVLVTVSRNPTVDQLASCLGLALMLNKQGKHTAAVFSGQVPSTIEFLEPEATLEKNTDSLRDFIIALDKSKADKLRYKVEDNVVRIFITPYKTSISQADLDFSQGDFNVDLVIALGVEQQEDLDEAITAHGRILHDATVASINITANGGLGSINWHDSQASSLSELVTDLGRAVDSTLLDSQISTALLTGIVSATDRFSNDKTTSQTMAASAALMAAGANQQLVASKLEEPPPATTSTDSIPKDSAGNEETTTKDDEINKPADDGIIEIEHDQSSEEAKPAGSPAMELPSPSDGQIGDGLTGSGQPAGLFEAAPTDDSEQNEIQLPETPNNLSEGSKLLTEPPTMGGTLTANSQPEMLDPSTDPFTVPNSEPPQLLNRTPEPPAGLTPPPADWMGAPTPDQLIPPPPPPVLTSPSLAPDPALMPPTPPLDDVSDPAPDPTLGPEAPSPESLSDLEERVKKSEEQAGNDAEDEAADLDDARDEVDRALSTAEATIPPKPIEALNAQPLVENIHDQPTAPLPYNTVTFPSDSPGPESAVPAPDAGQIPINSVPAIPSPESNNALPTELTTVPAPSPVAAPLLNDIPQVSDPTAPPPVPPPIPFQFGNPNPPQ